MKEQELSDREALVLAAATYGFMCGIDPLRTMRIKEVLRWLQQYDNKDTVEDEEPKEVGTLTKPFGLAGFPKAEAGHLVYELKDRYLIYLGTFKVPFYKPTLNPYIQFF